MLPDTIILLETFNQEDVLVNEYLTKKLKPIRDNFKRINSISKWETINCKELSETIEGGEVKYYYLNNKLEKIITRNYGESFQHLIEYYFLNRQLSFVYDKSYNYNRPMYYDSIAMKENNDT